ncbi:stemmadenine O-acetyltransferase-like [Punica granatum]|uniref:Uncharacterized protein n=2 Tax=Punica granatum TaxID=22663 RepID=A0A218WDJ4_PUNGR|nr:stemmadenine O-acetyltransferase-like [Punica granatum]OWM70593.1 hypothetical protein CDL15_Pgr014266 [Punica granatum]PKI55131.1 hypothetical protein CRG98_024422 [Punica granatum]
MEAKITSKELIRPSSPTPPHLRTFKLSLLDHLIPAPYAPMILFYPPDCGPHPDKPLRARLDLLKISLSQNLTRFYPLAGKIREDLFIDCDDRGVFYVEANVNVALSQFLAQPDPVLLQRFLPCELVPRKSSEETHTANIQVNVFECGGIAIGICISHKILDGAGLSGFLKEWAVATQGGCGSVAAPRLVAATDLFPADDLWLRDSSLMMWGSVFKVGKSVTKRFVFDGPAIEALKGRGTGQNVKNPTRVEAVSGFLWKCLVAVSQRKNNGLGRPSFLTHLVNFRNRMNPPVLELSLGNLLWIASTKLKTVDSDQSDTLPTLVSELREAISRIDGEFVSRLKWDKDLINGSLKEISDRMGAKGGVDYFGFSSWCKLGYYDVDFGWGKPVWVSSIGSGGSVFMNLVILADTRCGDGIEAWVTLDEQDMALLKVDPEIRSITSLDPNPFVVGNKP